MRAGACLVFLILFPIGESWSQGVSKPEGVSIKRYTGDLVEFRWDGVPEIGIDDYYEVFKATRCLAGAGSPTGGNPWFYDPDLITYNCPVCIAAGAITPGFGLTPSDEPYWKTIIEGGLFDGRADAEAFTTNVEPYNNCALPGRRYLWVVRGVTKEGDFGPLSDSVAASYEVDAPRGLSADLIYWGQVRLSWLGGGTGRYEILRDGESQGFLINFGSGIDHLVRQTWIDRLTAPGTTYNYCVKSVPVVDSSTNRRVCMSATTLPGGTDSDGDGVPDAFDAFPNNPIEQFDGDNDGVGDNQDLDDDNDGIPDIDELNLFLNPFDFADRDADYDFDGLTNYEEFLQGSNIWDPLSTIPEEIFVSGFEN